VTSLKDQLEYEAEALGTTVGTLEHARATRRLQVYKCREMQGLQHCSACPNYYDCTLVKEYLRDVHDGSPQ